MTKMVHHLLWQGIKIEVSYTPDWGLDVSHLEVRSLSPARAKLPITETGYRSHFIPNGTLESSDLTACEWVRAELDRAATQTAWLDHAAQSRQGELF